MYTLIWCSCQWYRVYPKKQMCHDGISADAHTAYILILNSFQLCTQSLQQQLLKQCRPLFMSMLYSADHITTIPSLRIEKAFFQQDISCLYFQQYKNDSCRADINSKYTAFLMMTSQMQLFHSHDLHIPLLMQQFSFNSRLTIPMLTGQTNSLCKLYLGQQFSFCICNRKKALCDLKPALSALSSASAGQIQLRMFLKQQLQNIVMLLKFCHANSSSSLPARDTASSVNRSAPISSA